MSLFGQVIESLTCFSTDVDVRFLKMCSDFLNVVRWKSW